MNRHRNRDRILINTALIKDKINVTNYASDELSFALQEGQLLLDHCNLCTLRHDAVRQQLRVHFLPQALLGHHLSNLVELGNPRAKLERW